MKEKYITDDEREKCRKVADAFAELYEIENILVVDAGRYGFVKLQYYRPPEGFEDAITFTDSRSMFDKLAEYKPLAKVEELTEQNYNMIDNVLNNGAEKKEQEQTKGRISIKEKLAEKRAVIEQRDKTERTSPEKETGKKSQREM